MVRKVRPAKSLTDKPESLWLTDAELERIKKQVVTLVEDKKRFAELHDDSSCDDDSDDSSFFEKDVPGECTRGLERIMEPEATKIIKFQAWDTVMNEQYLQRKEDEYDQDALAAMYGYATRRSQRAAHIRAVRDAEEAKSYLR
ncbi:MAG: hypothetical protein SGILL_007433, partial [Bacillariaceae sp.]